MSLTLIVVGVILLVVGALVPMDPRGARACYICGILLLVIGVILLLLAGLGGGALRLPVWDAD